MAIPDINGWNHIKAAHACLHVMPVQEYMAQAAQANALISIAKSLEEIVKILKTPGVR